MKCEGLKNGKLENSVARNHERTIAEVESVCGELLIEESSSLELGNSYSKYRSQTKKDQNGSVITDKSSGKDSFGVRRSACCMAVGPRCFKISKLQVLSCKKAKQSVLVLQSTEEKLRLLKKYN